MIERGWNMNMYILYCVYNKFRMSQNIGDGTCGTVKADRKAIKNHIDFKHILSVHV